MNKVYIGIPLFLQDFLVVIYFGYLFIDFQYKDASIDDVHAFIKSKNDFWNGYKVLIVDYNLYILKYLNYYFSNQAITKEFSLQ